MKAVMPQRPCCRSKSAMPEFQMRLGQDRFRLEGFAEDAQAAMQASPGYFQTWDILKTTALVIATGALVYVSGKPKRKR